MKNNNENSELIHLATQQLTGEASPEDEARLNQLLEEADENKRQYSELTKTWKGMGKVAGITSEETDAEWRRLQKAIRKSKVNKTPLSFMRIAASVAILVLAGLAFYFATEDREKRIVAKQIRTELLADGSSVTLNASAELSYPPGFGNQSREISLRGEAYFDVKRDIEKPFIIHTPSLDIKVLGTSFNVRVLENEPTAEVVVETGLVEISYGSKTLQLEVGEKGILNKSTGQLFKTFNDDVNFLAWKTKKFKFDDVMLEDVIRILNNAYQSSIHLRGTEISRCPVTVSFEEQSLDSILQVLKVTLELNVRKTDSGIEISGEGC